jgi:hypothetical protein
LVSQHSESTQGYLLEYFGIRDIYDLYDKCDELQQELKDEGYTITKDGII